VANRELVKVAIAEDHQGVRKGVRNLLEKLPKIVVVGEAKNGREALDVVERTDPDVLILDIQMPVMDGIQVIDALHKEGIDIIILVLSAIDDPLFVREILSLGVCRFVLKGEISELIQAVQQAQLGECHADEMHVSIKMRVHIY
jgi:DNA-binding NarL/FixJ family response regulator